MTITDEIVKDDDVAMRLWRGAFNAFEAAESGETCDKAAADAILSDGLRELLYAAEAATYMESGWTAEDLMAKAARLKASLAILLGEPPTVKGEK